MKLMRKLAFIVLFHKFIHSFFRRIRSELRSLKRQIPDLLMYGWPKFIIVASKPDADACASPMAFLLAKKLTVYQVWWRHVRAGEEHTPRGFEYFIEAVHFDTSRKFDGELVDGKLVKPGSRYFDHHHDRSFINHCATSLVIESFGLKDPVLNFLGEYVRLIDTGNPGGASAFLHNHTKTGEALDHIVALHRFFEVVGEPEMVTMINQVGASINGLRRLFQKLPNFKHYDADIKRLDECDKLLRAIVAFNCDYVKENFASAKTAMEAVIEKLSALESSSDSELYLAVYGIEKSNANILRGISSAVANLTKDIPQSEQLRLGSLQFLAFYNAETERRQILRQALPGGEFKRLNIKTATGAMVHVIAAENSMHLGNKMRTTIRQTFYESIDLIISGSQNGQIGLNLVNERRREVLSLRRFLDELIARYPAYAPSFLHNNAFVLYLKTAKDAKDKISFSEVVALVRELIEATPKIEPPPDAEVRSAVAPKALLMSTEVTM